MPVDIEGALREGAERTAARNGLLFAGILFVIGIVNGLFASSLWRGMSPQGAPWSAGTIPPAPSLGLSPAVAGLLSLVLTVASLVVTIGALRTFVSDETERIPAGYFTRNVALAAVNLIVGGIVFAVVVAIGFVLLVVPGVFLLVSLFFWNVYVVVEDRNFVDGMQRSWALTRGHRWRLLVLGIVVGLIAAVVSAVFGLPAPVLPRSIAFVVAQVGSALVSVFVTATVARTYVQLLALEGGGSSGAAAEEVAAT